MWYALPDSGSVDAISGSLLEVTAQAPQAEITPLIRPYVLLGDGMIDLTRKNGGALQQATVFTGVLRSTPYLCSPRFCHAQEAIRGAQYTSVWSLSTLSKSLRHTIRSYSACSS
jgi:hypothetical protein